MKFLIVGGSGQFGITLSKILNKKKNYKIRVRSMQYSFFGKNQKNEEIEKKIDKEVKEIINTKSYVKENVADDVPF